MNIENKTAPWQNEMLKEWSICGMNHYIMNGQKFLFVSLVKDGVCITEEGLDNKYLWNRLWHKALYERNTINVNKNNKQEIADLKARLAVIKDGYLDLQASSNS